MKCKNCNVVNFPTYSVPGGEDVYEDFCRNCGQALIRSRETTTNGKPKKFFGKAVPDEKTHSPTEIRQSDFISEIPKPNQEPVPTSFQEDDPDLIDNPFVS